MRFHWEMEQAPSQQDAGWGPRLGSEQGSAEVPVPVLGQMGTMGGMGSCRETKANGKRTEAWRVGRETIGEVTLAHLCLVNKLVKHPVPQFGRSYPPCNPTPSRGSQVGPRILEGTHCAMLMLAGRVIIKIPCGRIRQVARAFQLSDLPSRP